MKENIEKLLHYSKKRLEWCKKEMVEANVDTSYYQRAEVRVDMLQGFISDLRKILDGTYVEVKE